MFIDTSIRYTIVPWVAPASPAFMVGVHFYKDLAEVEKWAGWLAFLTAMSLAITIELGGVYIAKGFAGFWTDKDWMRMIISLVGLVGYGFFGVTLTWGTKLAPVFVFVTLLYLVIAAVDTKKEIKQQEEIDNKADIKQKEADRQIEMEQGEHNISLAKIQASGERAKARAAKFSNTDVKKVYDINQEIKEYLDTRDHPESVILKDILANTSIASTKTAALHKARYLQQSV